jgi:hypothetical protein
MKLFNFVSVSLIIFNLAGCSSMLPPDETRTLSNSRAKFTFVKSACVLGSGQYTDLTGKGNSHPMFKFIALTNSGATVGQWYALCDAVMPNGTSSCAISGPKKAYFECGDYDKFMMVN